MHRQSGQPNSSSIHTEKVPGLQRHAAGWHWCRVVVSGLEVLAVCSSSLDEGETVDVLTVRTPSATGGGVLVGGEFWPSAIGGVELEGGTVRTPSRMRGELVVSADVDVLSALVVVDGPAVVGLVTAARVALNKLLRIHCNYHTHMATTFSLQVGGAQPRASFEGTYGRGPVRLQLQPWQP